MQQIAIDLGGRKSQVCERSSDGKIVEERSCETRSQRAYLRQRPPSRVVIETCAEAFGVADALGTPVQALSLLAQIVECLTKLPSTTATRTSEYLPRLCELARSLSVQGHNSDSFPRRLALNVEQLDLSISRPLDSP